MEQRPWQQEPQTIMGRAWQREISADPEWLATLPEGGETDWDDLARDFAGDNLYPQLTEEEAIEFAASADSASFDAVREAQAQAARDAMIQMAETVDADDLVAAMLDLRVASDLGLEDAKAEYEELMPLLTDNERDSLKLLEGEWEGERGRYLIAHPTAMAARQESERNLGYLSEVFVESGPEGIRELAEWVAPYDPAFAETAARVALRLTQNQVAREVYGVGTGASTTPNDYATFLGYQNADWESAQDWTETNRDVALRAYESHKKRLQDAGLVDRFATISPLEGMSNEQRQRAGVLAGNPALQEAMEFYRNPANQEAMAQLVGEQDAQRAVQILGNVGPEMLADAVMQQAIVASRALANRQDLLPENFLELAQAAALRSTKAPPKALEWTLDILTRGSKAVAGAMSAGDDYGVRMFVFDDGTMTADPVEAYRHYKALVDAGADPGMSPEMEKAIGRRRRDLGLDKEMFPGQNWLKGRADLNRAMIAQMPHGQAAQGAEPTMYAYPAPIIDKVDRTTALEALGAVGAALGSGEGEMVMDAYVRRASLGYDKERGKVMGFMADVLTDPLNFLSFGALTTARGTLKGAQRVAKAAPRRKATRAAPESYLNAEELGWWGRMKEEKAKRHAKTGEMRERLASHGTGVAQVDERVDAWIAEGKVSVEDVGVEEVHKFLDGVAPDGSGRLASYVNERFRAAAADQRDEMFLDAAWEKAGKPMERGGTEFLDQAVAGIDPSMAKGRAATFFPTEGRMAEEWAGATRLISARMGGGAYADQFAGWLVEEVAKDPTVLQRGLKDTLLKNAEYVSATLIGAGDARVAQAMDAAVEAGRKAGLNVDDPTVVAELARQGRLQGTKEVLDEALPDLEAVIHGLDSVTAKPRFGDVANMGPGEGLAAAVAKGKHKARVGVQFGPLSVDVYGPLRTSARKMDELRQVAAEKWGLTALEKAKLKRLNAVPRWVASKFSPTHRTLQKGLDARHMSVGERRWANLTWAHTHARMTGTVDVRIGDLQTSVMGDEYLLRDPKLVSRDGKFLAQMIESGKDVEAATAADYILKYRDKFTFTRGMSEEAIRREVERLTPLAEAMQRDLDEIFYTEAKQGLHTEAVQKDGYIPHVLYSRADAPYGPSSAVAGAGGDAASHVSKGQRKVSSQHERTGYRTLVDAVDDLGEDAVELDAFALYRQRLYDHHLATSANEMLEVLSLSGGVPVVKGQRALMEAVADGTEAQWAAIGKPLTTLEQRGEYNRVMKSLRRAQRAADGAEKGVVRLEKMLGMTRHEMAQDGSAARLLEKPEFRRLIYKGDPLVRQLLDQDQIVALRKALKERGPTGTPYRFRRIKGDGEVKRATWYHGSGTRGLSAESIDPGMTKIEGLFGPGLYLTDNPDVAASYAKARSGGGGGVVYEAKVGDARILDLQTPLDRKFYQSLEKTFGGDYGIGEFWNDVAAIAAKRGATNEDVYSGLARAVEEYSHAEGVSTASLAESFQDLSIHLLEQGWDGFMHTGGTRVGGLGKHNVVILFDPSGTLGVSARKPFASFGEKAASKSADVQALQEALSRIGREAAAGDEAVRKLTAKLAAITGRDTLDIRTARRRAATQKLTTEERMDLAEVELKNPAYKHLNAEDAYAYQRAEDLAMEAGLTNEMLSTLLWDVYRVTHLSELSIEEAMALVRGDGALGKLDSVLGAPLRQIDGRITSAPKQSAMSLLNRVGIKGKGNKDFDAAYAKYVKMLDKEADNPEIARRLASLTPRMRRRIEEAAGGSTIYGAGDMAADVGTAFDSAEAKEFHEMWVASMVGNSPLSQAMKDIYVPLDLAVAMRTILNEKVGTTTAAGKAAQLTTAGVFAQTVDTMARYWKSMVTESAFGPKFAVRNKIDGMKGAMHIMGLEYFSPRVRERITGLLDGTLDGVQTAGGWMSRDEFLDALDTMQTDIGGRQDLLGLTRHAKKRNSEIADFQNKVAVDTVLAHRGLDTAVGKDVSRKVVWKAHRKELSAGTIGAMVGAALGGPAAALAAGGFSYSAVKTFRQMMQGGPSGVGGRYKRTARERFLPLHGAGTEINENYYRAMVYHHHRTRGLSYSEAIRDTLIGFRDYSNYTPQERKLLGAIPVLFYNFFKQNTIAQVFRLSQSPGFAASQAKLVEFLNDELDEDMRPDWMPSLSSVVMGGRAWMFSDELTAPFELMSTLSGKPTDALLPLVGWVRDKWEGKDVGRLPASLAKDLYNRYGTTRNGIIEIYVDEGSGQARASLTTVGAFMAVASGLDVVLADAGRLSDAGKKDHLFQLGLHFLTGIKAYDLRDPVADSLRREGLVREEIAKFMGTIEGLMFDEKAQEWIVASRDGLDTEAREILRRVANFANGRTGKDLVSRLTDLMNKAADKQTGQEAAEVK